MRYGYIKLIFLFSLLVNVQIAIAAIDVYPFENNEQEEIFRSLTQQLRCPKCQNNNINDSNAPIATDMRAKVHELIIQGQNEQQVVNYMVERYGDFVVYQPPVNKITIILWVAPILFLLLSFVVVFQLIKKNRGYLTDCELKDSVRTDNVVITSSEEARLQKLLAINSETKILVKEREQ